MELKEGCGPNSLIRVVSDCELGSACPRSYLLALPRRSLLVLSGESRYAWSHGITARRSDLLGNEERERTRRLSVTFRKARPLAQQACCASLNQYKVIFFILQVRGFACDCSFPRCCDSQSAPLMPSRLATIQKMSEKLILVSPQGCSSMDQEAVDGEAASNSGPPANMTSPPPPPPPVAGLVQADDEAVLRKLEADHVVAVYDAIAPHFSSTR
jgi:hypothetical protein